MDQHLFWHAGFRERLQGQSEMEEMQLMEFWPSPQQNQHLWIKSWPTNCASFSVWSQISGNYFSALACHSEVNTDCTVWWHHRCRASQHASRSRCRIDFFFRTGGRQQNWRPLQSRAQRSHISLSSFLLSAVLTFLSFAFVWKHFVQLQLF